MDSFKGYFFIASPSEAEQYLNIIQILILNRKTTTIKQLKLSLKWGHKNYFYSSIYTSVPPCSPDSVGIEWNAL